MSNLWSTNTAMNAEDVWDDSALIQMYEESLREVNRSAGVTEKTFTDAEGKTTTWKVGGNCMAPFEENGDKSYYPAKINSFGGTNNLEVEVTFYFYGNKAVVQMEELWIEEAAIAEAVAADEAEKSKATNTNTRASSTQQPATSTATPSLPEMVPVPPDVLNMAPPANVEEATNSALMSWYMAGYHSGYLKGMQHAQNSRH
ncbi:unnamed protein product [Caenorhabditis brenneri]